MDVKRVLGDFSRSKFNGQKCEKLLCRRGFCWWARRDWNPRPHDKSHRAVDRPEQTATVFATQLANTGYDRAIQDCYERTSKPNKISQIDIKGNRSNRT